MSRAPELARYLIGGGIGIWGIWKIGFMLSQQTESKLKEQYNIKPSRKKKGEAEEVEATPTSVRQTDVLFGKGPSSLEELRKKTTERRLAVAEQYRLKQEELVKKKQERERLEALEEGKK